MTRRGLGGFRQRLAAEAPVDARDAAGGAQRSFVAQFDLWARIEPISALPQFLASRDEATMTHRITIRAGLAVGPGWRLRKGARIFEILAAPQDDAGSGFVACRCREIG